MSWNLLGGSPSQDQRPERERRDDRLGSRASSSRRAIAGAASTCPAGSKHSIANAAAAPTSTSPAQGRPDRF